MRHALVVTALLALGAGGAAAQTTRPGDTAPRMFAGEAWPREFREGAEVLTVYQPQLDAWNGLQLDGQAAVSFRSGESEPTFGVMWFSARTSVDKPARMVTLEDLSITRTSFPSAADRAEAYTAKLRAQVASAPRLIALDRLEADLAILMAGHKSDAQPVRNDPPRIVFSSVPALLVHIDGAPAYRPVEGTSLQRVVNTRPLLLRDTAGTHFLYVFKGWREARGLEGPWAAAKSPSRELELARAQAVAAGVVDLLDGSGPPPAIHVATTPTELIVTEGEANWTLVGGRTQLLYVMNTSGHVFKHLRDQKTYVLVSGR